LERIVVVTLKVVQTKLGVSHTVDEKEREDTKLGAKVVIVGWGR
jgi:hypothetical protein